MLEQEMEPYRKIMTQASEVILAKEVTKYPVFVAHQQEIELGIEISKQDELKGLKWSIHASSLEEFVAKQIIHPDKVDEFKTNFKSTDTYVCAFVLSELGAKFVFLPKKIELK